MIDNGNTFLEDHIKEVGSFGYYQIFLFLLQAYANIVSYEFVWMIFVGYTPEHFCQIDNLSNFSYELQKANGVPKNSDTSYSSCRMYNLSYWEYSDQNLLNENKIEFHNETSTIPCEKWHYMIDHVGPSVITEYDWVCERSLFYVATLSFIGLGKLVGGLFGGYITDWFGRKPAWIVFLTLKNVGTLLSVAVPNQFVFILGQFLNNFANINFIYNVTLILVESTEFKYRNKSVMLGGMSWIIGSALLPLVAYLCGNWKYMMWLNVGLGSILYLSIFYVKESPRWLFLQGKFDEYQTVMNHIAWFNRTNNSVKSAEHFVTNGRPETKMSFIHLIRSKELRKRTLCLNVIWFTVGIIFYAIYLNVGELSGNIFMNSFLMGFVDIPIVLLVTWLQDKPRFGRKYTNIMLFMITFLTSLSIILFVELALDPMSVTVFSLFCKAAASSAWAAMVAFTSELYPTSLRTIGIMTGTAIGEAASIISPYLFGVLMKYWIHFPYVIMGGLGFISMILVSFLPETLNKVLPQTIADIETKEYSDHVHSEDLKL